MIQAILMTALGAFVFGFTSGGIVVHRWYNVSQLHGQIKFLKEDRRRYQAALQLGEKIDDASTEIEITNDDIQRALFARAATLASAPAAGGGVCVDGKWVLDLGALK